MIDDTSELEVRKQQVRDASVSSVARRRSARRKRVARRWTSTMNTRWRFIWGQLLHALLLFLFARSGNIWIFALSGAACIVAYTYLIRSEITQNRWVATPLVIYLFACLIRLGLTPIWGLACDLAGEFDAFRFSKFNMRQWVVGGQMLLVLGDALFIAGYTLYQRKYPTIKFTTHTKLQEPRKAAYWALGLSLPLILINQVSSDFLSKFGKFGILFSTNGIVAALLLMFVSRRVGRAVPWSVITFTLSIGLMHSLRSYMKQDTIVLLMPIGLIMIPIIYKKVQAGISLRNWTMVGSAVMFFILSISWLFTFSTIRRGEFSDGNGHTQHRLDESEVPVMPAAMTAAKSLLPWTEEAKEYQSLPDNGLWSIFARQADAIASGWTYNQTVTKGTLDGEFIGTGLISIIPRIIWRDKPQIAQGRKVAVMLGQAKTEEDATTSTHAGGMGPALFLDLGWPWLIIGMLLSGAGFALVVSLFFSRLCINPFAAIGCVVIYTESIRHFEASFDAGFSFYAYLIIVMLPLTKCWDLLHPEDGKWRV